MLVPLAPSQRRAEARARTRGPGRIHRTARWLIGVLLIAGAVLGFGGSALAATHPAATTAHQVVLTAELTPAAPGAPGGVSRYRASAT